MNQLIAALPAELLQRWQPMLEPVELSAGSVLYEAGSSPSHVYFPTDGIISLLSMTGAGASSEVAVVGNEGVVGIGLFMGGGTMPNRAVVQRAGRGMLLEASVIRREFYASSPVMRLLLRYTQALISQVGQIAVCNRLHALRQQLCRWLLMSLDRLPGNELVTTQLLIAQMLGVRREGVTEAASQLRRDGLIHYTRGRILVADRAGLERQCCECYAVVSKEYRRLLPVAHRALQCGHATGHVVATPIGQSAVLHRTWPAPAARVATRADMA